MKKIALNTLALSIALASFQAQAAQFTVSVQNLTQGIHFTPLLVAAHDADTHLFSAVNTVKALTIDEAKRGIAKTLNIDTSCIKISIKA